MSIKTLVIHPKDNSTDFLSEIYLGKDWTIIKNDIRTYELEEQIKQHDRIIMVGHGIPSGLLGYNKLIINQSFVPLLKEKQNNVYIWCHANKFVENNDLKGFVTGMIISEWLEAVIYGILPNTNEIDESNKIFAKTIAKHIDADSRLIYENVSKEYEVKENEVNNSIIEFNKKNLFYYN